MTGPEKTDDQGRFRLTGLIPSVAFDLKVMLVSDPDPKGQQFIKGFVKVTRATVKQPGATLDLGDLKLPESAEK